MSNQISPLPWAIGPEHDYEIYDAKGDYLALMMDARDGDDEANAAFIVKAVNSHDKLVAALRKAHEVIESEFGRPCTHLDEIEDVLAAAGEGHE